jgi:hypothetical protein
VSKPWKDVPTPLTDAVLEDFYAHFSVADKTHELQAHARDLERRCRHAESLVYQALYGGFATDSTWQDDAKAHLGAANEDA